MPYLKDQTSHQEHGINKARLRMRGVNQKVIQKPSTTPLLDGSLSYSWPAPFKAFIGELIGINVDEST